MICNLHCRWRPRFLAVLHLWQARTFCRADQNQDRRQPKGHSIKALFSFLHSPAGELNGLSMWKKSTRANCPRRRARLKKNCCTWTSTAIPRKQGEDINDREESRMRRAGGQREEKKKKKESTTKSSKAVRVGMNPIRFPHPPRLPSSLFVLLQPPHKRSSFPRYPDTSRPRPLNCHIIGNPVQFRLPPPRIGLLFKEESFKAKKNTRLRHPPLQLLIKPFPGSGSGGSKLALAQNPALGLGPSMQIAEGKGLPVRSARKLADPKLVRYRCRDRPRASRDTQPARRSERRPQEDPWRMGLNQKALQNDKSSPFLALFAAARGEKPGA